MEMTIHDKMAAQWDQHPGRSCSPALWAPLSSSGPPCISPHLPPHCAALVSRASLQAGAIGSPGKQALNLRCWLKRPIPPKPFLADAQECGWESLRLP